MLNQKKRIRIRPLNNHDIIVARGKSFQQTVKGIAVDLDGELAVIAGVVHTRPLQAISIILNQEIRNHRRAALPIRRAFMKILEEFDDSPIYAIADEKYSTPEVFLRFFGFKQIKEGVYQWKIPSR